MLFRHYFQRPGKVILALLFASTVAYFIILSANHIYDLPYEPIILFVFASIIGTLAFHYMFEEQIFNAKNLSKIKRSVFFKSIDCIWLISSIFAGVLAVSSYNVRILNEQYQTAEASYLLYMRDAKLNRERNWSSCSNFVQFYKRDPHVKKHHVVVAYDLCEKFLSPTVGFGQACINVERSEPNLYGEVAFGKELENPYFNYFMTTFDACYIYKNIKIQSELSRDLKRKIDTSKLLPDPNSNLWIYVISLAVGIRLIKTTSEVVDAL